jgi:hypothetical protein
MLTALGLVLLVLGREHHGVLIFEQWAEDAASTPSWSTASSGGAGWGIGGRQARRGSRPLA